MSDELVALVDKYERMLALRERLGRGQPAPAERELLRELARDFPGALRELESIDTPELRRRAEAARRAAGGGDAPDWLIWTAAYHELMREALRLRASGGESRAPHGRLNVLVFAALAERFGHPASHIWDTLFPRRGNTPRPYR